MSARLAAYWHTLRYLKPVQLYCRFWFRFYRPRPDVRPAPPLRAPLGRGWVLPPRRNASLVGPNSFCFLNEIYDLSNYGWDDPRLAKLWRYNLHYFDDLNAEGAHSRAETHRRLLVRWVHENPPGVGTGWEPYPTSLRIVNWVKWSLSGNPLPKECVHSLAIQARWLRRRMEFHLLGNHLFANAKALAFAGLFFDGAEATRWLEKGMRVLESQVPEQILSDGGHFERSPMYHALALEDMQDLYNLTSTFSDAVPIYWQSLAAAWWDSIAEMRDWLAAMCHPDGEISYFNDAAIGVAPTPNELEHYAAKLGFPERPGQTKTLTHLSASGYIRIEGSHAVAILDVAPIGPDYLPGHAHADTLSFELSLFGQRVFVNSGTSCYGEGAERLRQRGTAAHNTVTVDGQNSSEVWAGFRVARRARPQGLEIKCNGEIGVRCAHDGYQRLPGKPKHLREWVFSERKLVVEDRVSGIFQHAEARFYLHPSVRVDADRPAPNVSNAVVLKLPQGQKVRFSVEGGSFREEPASWHPGFGSAEPNLCLLVSFEYPCSAVRSRIEWDGAA